MQRLEVSGAVRPLQGSLGVKGLIRHFAVCLHSIHSDKITFKITLIINQQMHLHKISF